MLLTLPIHSVEMQLTLCVCWSNSPETRSRQEKFGEQGLQDDLGQLRCPGKASRQRQKEKHELAVWNGEIEEVLAKAPRQEGHACGSPKDDFMILCYCFIDKKLNWLVQGPTVRTKGALAPGSPCPAFFLLSSQPDGSLAPSPLALFLIMGDLQGS